MANIPNLRSKEQIAGDLIDGILARIKTVNDLNKGSVISQLIEAISQNVFSSSASVIAMIDALSVDRAEGEALQRLARDRNVPIFAALPSSGRVDITDISFEKISTTVYSGQPAPVAGSLVVYVSDASKFNASGGEIYIGRGTTNVEGPLTYTSVSPQSGGAYWAINLSATTPTTKFHNIGEVITLAQGGNRFVPAGTSVQTAQGSSVTSVSFSTSSDATILDGEVSVADVPVICNAPGTIGNVARGAITDAVGLPFDASVFNSFAFTNGREADTEDEIRARIKAYEQAKSKGTELAIRLAAIGVVAPDELKKVKSSSIVRYTDFTSTLVFDDGSGYEPNFKGASFETIVDSAIGGEVEVQLRQKPIAQARLKNNIKGPYPITDLSYLVVEINGVESAHQFKSSDFKVPSAATAFEIAASINGNPNLTFLCSTSENGSKLVIYPRDRSANNIKIKVPQIGLVDANEAIGFPDNDIETIRLYKNYIPLYQDGATAKVTTRIKSTWSASISTGDTLIYRVDGTPDITATFTLADFQAIDPTATVSSGTDINIWAEVMNRLMPGCKTQVNGDVIDIISNRENDDRAIVEITGGTLKDKIFAPGSVLYSKGKTPDFTVNRQTGQISLAVPLLPGDNLTAGSQFTRGQVLTGPLSTGVSVNGRAWFIVDGQAASIANDLKPNTQVTFNKTGTKLKLEGLSTLLTAEGFDQVKEGDWLLVWANPSDPAPLVSNQGFWRVESAQVGEIIVDDGPVSRSNLGIGFTPVSDRIVVVRSEAPMQLLEFTPATLSGLLSQVTTQLVGVDASIIGSKIRISTQTFDDNGEIMVVAFDQGGAALGLTAGDVVSNTESHFGFSVTSDSEANVPTFMHGVLGTAITDKDFTEANYANHGGSGDDFIEILEKYNATTSDIIAETNKKRRAFVTEYDKSTGTLYTVPPKFMQLGGTLMQDGDRYFLRSSYKFDSRDSVGVIVDGDAVTKSYTVPIARKLTVSAHSAPTTQTFSADDGESSLDLNDQASFKDFDFDDFKIHRQAQTTLTDGTYEVRIKNVDFGPSKTRVGIHYQGIPGPAQPLHKIEAGEVPDIKIYIPTASSRTANWDHTSAFTVSKTSAGGKDILTYTWRAGTQPDFISAAVSPGDIAFISSESDFLPANKGIQGRISAVAADSITIELPASAGQADSLSFSSIVNENGVVTITTTAPHNLSVGDRIGLWNTGVLTGAQYPFNGAYVVTTIINPSSFTVAAPVAAPTANVQAGNYANDLIEITTQTPHGLYAGNIVNIGGALAPFNGLAPVWKIISANKFSIMKHHTSPASIGAIGRVDFQSYTLSGIVANSSAISKVNGLVTVDTVAPHSLTSGDIIEVQSAAVSAWSNVVNYLQGTIVLYSGIHYICVAGASLGQQPDITPAAWTPIVDFDLNGRFIVYSTPSATQFTYYHYYDPGVSVPTITASATTSTATKMVSVGSMARGLAGNAGDNLQIFECTMTAQEMVDYVAGNLSDYITAEITNGNPSAPISISTADIDLATNYLGASISSVKIRKGSRVFEVRTGATLLPKGTNVTLSGLTTYTQYNGSYVVVDSYYDVDLLENVIKVQSSILGAADVDAAETGSIVGYKPGQILEDGENSVKVTNLAALIGSPKFTAKEAWTNAPEIGEEVRLVAVTSDHINRLWNRLVVTGLSNVAEIKNSEYGRQIQVAAKTFGEKGSIEIVGGTGNKVQIALAGATAEIGSGKLGLIRIPYEIKKGLTGGQWINVKNTVRQNKSVGFGASTVLDLTASTVEIIAGSGTFQTERATGQSAATKIKIERHGKFVAFIGIDGPSFNLSSAGVKEGDWVMLRNQDASAWSPLVTYNPSDRANLNGVNYTSLTTNLNSSPDSNPSDWERQEFAQANEGIYQVVRTFGDDTFWIEFDNVIEEIMTLGDAQNIRFFSYDSVMPGDTLVINSDILGAQNIGRYTVVDETVLPTYQFPTSTIIHVSPAIPNPPIASILLGNEYGQVNVEEKDPVNLWKRIYAIGPDAGTYASILLDSPELTNKLSASLGAYLDGKGKIEFPESINFGVDAYKYYVGLIKELNRIVYGDPSDSISYPGIRAAGTKVEIKEAIIRRIKASFSVRLKTGVPFTEVRDRIKASVAGYVNDLGVGEAVSISSMVAAASSIPGVVAVAVTSPTYDSSNDLIVVGPEEKAFVVDPTIDITISLIGL